MPGKGARNDPKMDDAATVQDAEWSSVATPALSTLSTLSTLLASRRCWSPDRCSAIATCEIETGCEPTNTPVLRVRRGWQSVRGIVCGEAVMEVGLGWEKGGGDMCYTRC